MDRWREPCMRIDSGILASADIDAICARLGLSPMPGSRRSPDGTEVTWRTAGLEVALGRMLSSSIEWDRSQAGRIDLDGEPGVRSVRLTTDGRDVTLA